MQRKNKIKQSYSTIDIYLTQRFDLIPNLVECVKEYENYEQAIFENITEMRVQYMKNKKWEYGTKLDKVINDVLVTMENYPELKANEQFLELEKNLVQMENRIQAARRIYNIEVTKYNKIISFFPNNLFAKLLKFKEEPLFQIEDGKEVNISIKSF